MAGSSELTGTRRGKLGANIGRRFIWLFVFASVVFSQTPLSAVGETRTIAFRNMHTNETLTIVYMRNGRHIPDAMRQINQVLRDWRRNESIRMNPKLIDLAYDVHRATGSHEPINVVSGYRSPVTNAALRRRSSGVARNSQHILGNAMDIYIPDVTVKKIREVALRFQRGGVGYYPTSGRPFVHIDVGSVRHWPRMSPTQLAQVFPDGNTLHTPTGGKPLPRTAPSTTIMVASADSAPQQQAVSAPAPRQQVVRPTPGVDPLIVASISQDSSLPAGSQTDFNPLTALGIGGSNAPSPTASAVAAARQAEGQESPQADEPPLAFDVAAMPLPNLRPEVSNDRQNTPEIAPEQQLIMAASAIPMPSARPDYAPEAGSRIALAYGNADPQPQVDQSNFNLASIAGNSGSPTPSGVQYSGESGLNSDRLTALIEAELTQDAENDETGGIWSRSLTYGYPVSRDLVSAQRAEGQAFAQFYAPRLTNLHELSARPRYSLALSFTHAQSGASPASRFEGPAVQPLRLASAI